MPTTFLKICIVALQLSVFASAVEFESYVGYSSLSYDLSTEITRNKDYQLYIHLPASYGESKEKTYPVLYLLDPYWDFGAVTGMLGTLEYDKLVPEMIVVGIGYSGENAKYDVLRQIDYTPVVSKADENTGDANAFLGFIEKELIPFVESEFRVDESFRALAGASYGGMFVLYAMLERPDLFQGIVSNSPSISYEGRWLIQRESDFYLGDREELWPEAPARDLPVRLFMGVGSLETELNWIQECKAFDALIKDREYDGFAYEFAIFQDFKHGGVKYPTYSRGMPFVFRDYVEKLNKEVK